ncbi:hypothetical protein Aduo_005104 [Ancylostoma duodenale]
MFGHGIIFVAPDKTFSCPTSRPPLPPPIKARSALDSMLPPQSSVDQTKFQTTPHSTTKKITKYEYDQRTWPNVSSYMGYSAEQQPINTGLAGNPYARAYIENQAHGPILTQHSINDCIIQTHVNGIALEPRGRHNGRDTMNDIVTAASTPPFVRQVKQPTLELPELVV